MQCFRRQTQLKVRLPWAYFQELLQNSSQITPDGIHTWKKKQNKKHLVVMPACCFLLAKLCLFKIEGTSAWNWIAACLQPRRCPGKATNCCDGQAAVAVYCLEQEQIKAKKRKKKTESKIVHLFHCCLNKRGGEDRKGTAGGPKSYCQYKTLSRSHKFKIKKENGMKKIVQKKHFRFCY